MTNINDVPTITWDDGPRQPLLTSLLRPSKALVRAIEALPEELLCQGERNLEKQIRSIKKDGLFPRTLGLLKIKFWEEYRLAVDEKRLMVIEDVFYGVCMPDYWSRNVINNPMNLAWLIHPPTDELTAQKELIGLGMKKLRDVFDFPIYKEVEVKKKKVMVPDLPLIREMHAILKTMQDRVNGSVIERKQIAKHIKADIHTLPTPPPGYDKYGKKASVTEEKQISLSSPDLTLDDLIKFQRELEVTAKAVAKAEKELEALPPPPPGETVEAEIVE